MKILLVEDEIKALKSLSRGLEENQIEVDSAPDAPSAETLVLSGEYDVIVSDIIMPGASGLDFTRFIRSKGINTPVLLLTALGSTDDKVLGLEAGADDYLTKPFEFKELLARIKALSRRHKESGTLNSTIRFSDIELNLLTKECYRGPKKIDLTPKEFALMEYLIRNKGRTVSKSEIAEKVWDINFETTSNVVEVYVNYLRNKVDKPFPTKLIHTVFGQGYILKEQ